MFRRGKRSKKGRRDHIKRSKRRNIIKNPAYGRHQLSRPMRIVAPIPQKGGPRIHKNQKKKIKNGKNNPKRKNSKMSRDMPKLAIYPLTRGL